MMGDSRNNSADSRVPGHGAVPVENVIGKARLIVLPFARFGWIAAADPQTSARLGAAGGRSGGGARRWRWACSARCRWLRPPAPAPSDAPTSTASCRRRRRADPVPPGRSYAGADPVPRSRIPVARTARPPRRPPSARRPRPAAARAAPARAVVRRAGTWTLQTTLDRHGLGPVAGVDEAGRGACAGPLVVAACVLRPGDAKRLDGLTDSKLLTAAAREEYYELIMRRAEDHAVVVIPPEEVDRRGRARGQHRGHAPGGRRAGRAARLRPDRRVRGARASAARAGRAEGRPGGGLRGGGVGAGQGHQGPDHGRSWTPSARSTGSPSTRATAPRCTTPRWPSTDRARCTATRSSTCGPRATALPAAVTTTRRCGPTGRSTMAPMWGGPRWGVVHNADARRRAARDGRPEEDGS